MSEELRQIFEAVRQKRKEKGFTQSQLAKEAGCTQSAISMFEAGRSDALAGKTVQRIGEILGIDLSSLSQASSGGPAQVEGSVKYCPVDECLSNVPYVVRGRLCFMPAMWETVSGETTCRFCGELLESECPNEECRAPLVKGSFCPACGSPYVSPGVNVSDPIEWADAQRQRIGEILSLSDAVSASVTGPRLPRKDDTR